MVAVEVMLVTGAIRDCITDPELMEEIIDLIQEGREQYGSQTFDQHLMDLVKSGIVEFELAKAAANSPSDFDLKWNLIGGSEAATAPESEVGGFTL